MVQLHLACNDYRNGNHTGYVEKVEIGTDALSVTGVQLQCRIIRSENSRKPRFLKLGHLEMRIESYVSWAGNWCWDMALVKPAHAAKVANYLKERGWYCESGWAETFAKWESGESFVADDFLELEKEQEN